MVIAVRAEAGEWFATLSFLLPAATETVMPPKVAAKTALLRAWGYLPPKDMLITA